jgi:hypothetical protein
MDALHDLLATSLRRLMDANARLGTRSPDGQMLYETSVVKSQDAYEAWLELNDAIKQANLALSSCKIENDPDVDDSAGRPVI